MKKLYLLTCSYFTREMKKALPAEHKQRIEVLAFPAHCGQAQLNWDDIARIVPAKESGAEVILFASACMSGSDPAPAELSHCRSVQLQQCFHLLCPPQIVDTAIMQGSYLLTPGYLDSDCKQIKDERIAHYAGQSFQKESVKQLLLLDTGVDQAIEKKLQTLADSIGVPQERLTIGLDYLKLLLQHEISMWQMAQLQCQHQQEQMQVSNYVMSLNLLANLTQSSSEEEVVDGIFELFTMLFAPEKIVFYAISDGVIGAVRQTPDVSATEKQPAATLPEMDKNYLWCEPANGFWLRLQHRKETMGLLKIEQFAMPQYKEAYLKQALSIIDVCALLIDNARILNKLLNSAHIAGKAEVAIEVLHNVGNVLNSINISTQIVTEKLQQSIGRRLTKVAALLNEHEQQLADFLSNDPRGKKLPAFFSLLAIELEKERNSLLQELEQLSRHLMHVKAIIRTQQVYSSSSALVERASFAEIFEEAVQIYREKIELYHISIIREFAHPGVMNLQKQKLLQIMINLISNAIDSLALIDDRERHIILRLIEEKNQLVFEVADNGIGILHTDIKHIFTHGFSTKPAHSGFGLHSIANLATEMGATLSVSSEGKGQGACFRFEYPLIKDEGEVDANN